MHTIKKLIKAHLCKNPLSYIIQHSELERCVKTEIGSVKIKMINFKGDVSVIDDRH